MSVYMCIYACVYMYIYFTKGICPRCVSRELHLVTANQAVTLTLR